MSANANWDIVGTCNILGVNMGKLLPIVITVNWDLKELTSQYVEYHEDIMGMESGNLQTSYCSRGCSSSCKWIDFTIVKG